MSASPAFSHFDLEPDPTFLAAVASFCELRIFETPFQRPGPSEGLSASWKPSSEAPWKQGDELLSMLDFLQRAEDSSVPSSPPFSELHPDFAFASKFVADPAKFVVNYLVAWRANQMSRFAKAAASLEPWNVKLLALSPAHLVAMDKIGRQLRPAVIAALTDAIVWPDQKLAFFMVKGFPATGNLPSNFTWSRSLERVIYATARAALELEPHPPAFVKGNGKARVIDNARRSLTNAALSTKEKLVCCHAELPVSIARHIAASSPPGALPELGLGSDDVQAAYRVLPSSQPGLTVAALCKRKASGQAALDLVFSTVGLGLDIGEHKEVAVTNIFLGLEFNFSDFAAKDLIYVGVSQKRRDTLGTLDKVLAEDYLTSGNAASLCGKLRFTLSPLFSRVEKAALSSIQAWGSSSKPSVSDVPTIVLTDAMYQRGSSRPAGLGAVYSFPESTGIVPRRIFTFGEADAAFLAALANFGERATYISQLEVLAVLAAISGEAGERLRGQVVHFYIDNQSALSGLHKGYSGCLDMAHLINAFWLRALELRITPWFSYVPSKSNLADLPSRPSRGSKRAAASDPTSASPSRDSAPRLL
ncbi:hypothetical protein T492DRAFT_896760 [Pavlovales sp. CCMP2436]|nr:hypothetical protein T492DRAFT_896760 [Pavlovales sp. CCMP2436]